MSKKKLKELTIDASCFRSLPTPNVKLERAAKLVMKDIKSHFKHEGWDLDFNLLLEDVFAKAFGHHLENYLLKRLPKGVEFTTKSGVKSVFSKAGRRK